MDGQELPWLVVSARFGGVLGSKAVPVFGAGGATRSPSSSWRVGPGPFPEDNGVPPRLLSLACGQGGKQVLQWYFERLGEPLEDGQ